MENTDGFVEMIHMVYRKLKYFHYYLGYICGLRVCPYFIERQNASRVPVGVLPTAEGEPQDMIVGEWEEANKTFLHMVGDNYLHHK